MLVKASVAVVTVVLMQDPVRLATEVLILRSLRRTCPQLFDGPGCAAAVAACLDEYERELAGFIAGEDATAGGTCKAPRRCSACT